MRHQSRSEHRIMMLFPFIILFLGGLFHLHALPNHDVAWFAWGARAWLNGAVIGRDLTDPNFPLGYMLYAPAIGLSYFMSFTQAINTYVLLLTAAVITLSWHDVPTQTRLPLFSVLAFFIGFSWPREFAQREELVMLLVFPYIVPDQRQGWRAIVTGVMAGIGFAVKPFFLIPWILIEINRRPFRPEQLALMATGALYAVSLPLFFPTFLFHLLPLTTKVYGAFNRPSDLFHVALRPSVLAIMLWLVAWKMRNGLALAFALATIGFDIAAIAQMKFYSYQFLPTCGYMVLGSVAVICSGKISFRLIAWLLLLLTSIPQIKPAHLWYIDSEKKAAQSPLFLKKLQEEGAHSFSVIGVHPYPAFPTAVIAMEHKIDFTGTASSYWFLPAAAQGNRRAVTLAQQQLLTDLSHRPDVIIVDTNWRRHTVISHDFNGLKLLLQDPQAAREWKNYSPDGSIDNFVFYKRTSIDTTRRPRSGMQ
ncbi:hypothetical protein S101446_02521 [Komagataeibacter europaeus]|nr:hypothetical protein S101446_02521 [Komagataeibacter europaeus]